MCIKDFTTGSGNKITITPGGTPTTQQWFFVFGSGYLSDTLAMVIVAYNSEHHIVNLGGTVTATASGYELTFNKTYTKGTVISSKIFTLS